MKWSIHFFPAQALKIESTLSGHSDFNETFQRVSACEYLESEKRVFFISTVKVKISGYGVS